MNQVTDDEIEAAALAIWVDANGWTPPDAQDRLTLPWSLCCRQARAALRTRPAVDEGMVLVPREPTREMLDAGRSAPHDLVLRDSISSNERAQMANSYRAMIAAAPTASPVQPGGETGDGWRTIDTAPKDGTPFIVRYLPYLSGTLCMRRVRWVQATEGGVNMEDMGAWLIVTGIDDDFNEHRPTSGEPSWSIAADANNDTAKWAWQPLPAPTAVLEDVPKAE